MGYNTKNSNTIIVPSKCIKTAILVDGGFYLKRSYALFGEKAPKQRAEELVDYTMRHLKGANFEQHSLYRIFYYDCKPSDKNFYHPLLKKNIDLSKSEQFKWKSEFYQELCNKRKVALRMGELLESSSGYSLKNDKLKKLCAGTIQLSDLTEDDFVLDIKQKGVDMRIGLDISSLANKHLVDQIILIAGDSDFVPAAKYARREGIDFILDPMWNKIKPSLNEHIDGLKSQCQKPPYNTKDSLHISHISLS